MRRCNTRKKEHVTLEECLVFNVFVTVVANEQSFKCLSAERELIVGRHGGGTLLRWVQAEKAKPVPHDEEPDFLFHLSFLVCFDSLLDEMIYVMSCNAAFRGVVSVGPALCVVHACVSCIVLNK